MAVFGRDFYGLSKYGANVHTEFDVNPFDANPDGYGAIRVTWHSPAGSWNSLRLLRSKAGYAVDETDGMILLDTPNSADHYVDTDLVGGTWYYYTLFIEDATGWNRAGATSALAVKKPWTKSIGQVVGLQYETQTVDFGYADLMWERIPSYYKYVRRDGAAVTDEYVFAPTPQAFLQNPEQYDQENQHLRSFLNVLGWGLDYVHNYEDTLLNANDPHQAHLSDVDRLAAEMGIDFEYAVPASVMRSKVANAALLARRRGTLQGLADVAALSTGWDVDIAVNQNLFLNRDQSEFANPIFPEWDSGTNYAVGQKVQFEGRIFTALIGAYGDTEKPPFTGTNTNTWWTVTTDTDVTTLHNPATDAVVTWKGFQDGTTPQALALAIGVSDPISGADQESNALAIRNGSGSHAYDVVGASNLIGSTDVLPDPQYAIRQGIPIPRPVVWSPVFEYGLGLLVQHKGAAWRSTGTSLGEEPADGSTYWEKVGSDSRPLLAYSFYAHGPLAGVAGSGGVAVTPGLSYFDEQGNLLLDQTNVTPMSNFVFDTFNHPFGTPDYGSWGNWATSGVWDTEPIDGDDPVAYPVGLGTATITVPASLTQYRLSATFSKPAASGATDALVLRYADALNFIRVTRTKVEKSVAGTLSLIANLSTVIADGDRVTVTINDTANTFAVLLEGSQIASGPLTGGSSPYKHGMMVL